jgi:hypothetical protein
MKSNLNKLLTKQSFPMGVVIGLALVAIFSIIGRVLRINNKILGITMIIMAIVIFLLGEYYERKNNKEAK